ncbi:MAG: hypothetical protein EOM53_05615 [Alphaproteobacteria bacterium]|nr:hypothetical protein [Alphaproteobacteria bacterium]
MSIHPVIKPQWKKFLVLIMDYQTKETQNIEVYALNKGQAGFLALRKSTLVPAGVERVEEIS